MTVNEICKSAKSGDKFAYMILDRMKQDCLYYLGYGNRCKKYLWSGNEKNHIDDMKQIWNAFPVSKKPEWLSMGQIEEYEKEMTKHED